MPWREIIAVCSENPAEHRNVLCGKNGERFCDEPADK
jgi:hypothetical protein